MVALSHPAPPRLAADSTVLLATEASRASAGAAARAIELARSSGARLLVVSVIEDGPAADGEGGRIDQRRAARERAVDGLVARARDAGVKASYLVWSGPVGPALVEAARAEGADVIVIGTARAAAAAIAGRRPGRRSEATVGRYLARHAPCPVVTAA